MSITKHVETIAVIGAATISHDSQTDTATIRMQNIGTLGTPSGTRLPLETVLGRHGSIEFTEAKLDRQGIRDLKAALVDLLTSIEGPSPAPTR